ncbi:MAG: hypothetical protein MZV63_14405 [Marinilabiliales bacterium]|nr:hypothetical protein [Marinilabiliales bacterium]
MIADLPAVDAQLVVAEPGDVGPGPLDPSLEVEFLAELVLVADPDALPVAFIEEPGVEAGDLGLQGLSRPSRSQLRTFQK